MRPGATKGGILVAGRRGRWLWGVVVWAVPLGLVGSALALVTNAASNVARWPYGLDVLQRHPFRWAAGLTVAGIVLGVVQAWWFRRLELQDDTQENTRTRSAAGRAGRLVFGAIPRQARWFQPRPVEQAALVQALGRKGKAALVALPGARGAGKSQLAAVYARDCVRRGFDLVAWINAENGPVAELAELAERLGLRSSPDQSLEQLADAAIETVSQDDGRRRLLVFDNVDDPAAIANYLPSIGPAKVLITTNRRDVTTTPDVVAVEVGMFTPPQGRALLTAATGLPDDEHTLQVGVLLGWLPLGVAQAGAYIKLNNLTHQQYAQRLSRVDVSDVLMQQTGVQHPGVLKATALSLAALDISDPTGHSARLLTVLAMLSADGVRRAQLTDPAVVPAIGMTSVQLEHALSILTNASLITQSAPETNPAHDAGDGVDRVVVAVHRLTATVVRYHAATTPEEEAYDQSIEVAARILTVLTDNLPLSQAGPRRGDAEELIGHILALRSHTQRFAKGPHLLSTWAAGILRDVGNHAAAIAIYEQVAADALDTFGPEHSETLTTRNNLANAYREAGRYGDAIRLDEQNLVDRERIFGSEDPRTLLTRNNLAAAYNMAGRYGDAIRIYEQNLADYERIAGPDHPAILMSRNNLANAYSGAGRYPDAIRMYEQNLADCVRILGLEHTRTLTTRNNLGLSYERAGRHGDAIRMLGQTLADQERILGPEHPNTLTTRNNLAVAYSAAGRHADAIRMDEQNLVDRKRILGDDHPETLATRNNLAMAYCAVGRYEEAVRLHEKVFADYERILGHEHPDTLMIRHNLAATYGAAGRHGDALRTHEQNFANIERALGPAHPFTLLVRSNLAETYRAAGRHEDAARLTPPA